MKRKALITGARPHPFEGPWVSLEEESEWEMEGLRPGVRVEHVPVGREQSLNLQMILTSMYLRESQSSR
ncbi:hypothetical protein LCGC14_2410740 [marine sediment metagenome]|uniref:Uncharacterized protein n=1 Tax=marine sediment metagenome TaxID=412755 RepID=A0A0F9EM15_9ZZZZ